MNRLKGIRGRRQYDEEAIDLSSELEDEPKTKPKKNQFLASEDENYNPTFQRDRNKAILTSARLQRKINEIEPAVYKLPESINSFSDFFKIKSDGIEHLIEDVKEDLETLEEEISNLTLDIEVVSERIKNLVQNQKEKFEVVAYIQRKINFQEKKYFFCHKRMKLYLLLDNLEGFITMGDLCCDFGHFDDMAKKMLEENKVFLERKNNPEVGICLLYDLLREQYNELQSIGSDYHVELMIDTERVDRIYNSYVTLDMKEKNLERDWDLESGESRYDSLMYRFKL